MKAGTGEFSSEVVSPEFLFLPACIAFAKASAGKTGRQVFFSWRSVFHFFKKIF
jgi:hypothetical protein